MTKLEEVARAICVAAGFDPDDDPNATGGPLFTDVAFPEHWRKWHTFLRQARAAVEALRTVNDAMLSAGEIAVDDGETYGCRWKAESAYHAILDAILSEGE